MARQTKIAAIFGHPTHLIYDHRHARPRKWPQWLAPPPAAKAECNDWAAGQRLQASTDAAGDPFVEPRLDAERPGLVRKRWVYVFLYDQEKNETPCFLELWLDDNTNVHVNPEHGSERLQWSPPDGVRVDDVDVEQGLPRLVAGRRQWATLIATPFRLTDEALDVLGKDNKILSLATSVDLGDKKLLEAELDDVAGSRVPSVDFLVIPVLSVFDVARNLSLDIQHNRSFRQRLMGQDGQFHTATRDDEELADEYAFSRSLLGVAEHPRLKDEVDDDFGKGKLDELRKFVRSHEQRLVRPDFLAEAIGAELVAWLQRELVDILMDGCLPSDGGRLLLFLDEITAGLSQTGPGLAYLGALGRARHRSSFMGRVFDGTKPLEPKTIKLANRGLKHFAKVFTAVWVSMLIVPDTKIETVLHSLETVLGSVGPGWQSSTKIATGIAEVFALRPKLGPDGSPAARLHAQVKSLVATRASLEKLGKGLGYADLGFKIIDSLNVALALRAYFATEITQEDLRAKNGMAAVMYGADLMTALLNKGFDIAGRETVAASVRGAVRFGGLVVAAYTVYSGFLRYTEARDRGDYDAMVAIAAATGWTTVGMSIAYFSGVAAEFGPIGWAIAATGGLLYFVYLYVRDSDVETFVLHCAYGDRAGKDGGGQHVPWCPVPLRDLAKSWSRQSEVLGLIQRQFALGFGERASVGKHSKTPFYKARLYTGYVDTSTKFDVVWKWTAVYGSGEHGQTFSAKNAPTKAGEVDFADMLEIDGNGELYIDINIPDAAWQDCGYTKSGGGYGFDDLAILARKSYSVRGGVELIPLDDPILLTVQRGTVAPNVDTRVVSMRST